MVGDVRIGNIRWLGRPTNRLVFAGDTGMYITMVLSEVRPEEERLTGACETHQLDDRPSEKKLPDSFHIDTKGKSVGNKQLVGATFKLAHLVMVLSYAG